MGAACLICRRAGRSGAPRLHPHRGVASPRGDLLPDGPDSCPVRTSLRHRCSHRRPADQDSPLPVESQPGRPLQPLTRRSSTPGLQAVRRLIAQRSSAGRAVAPGRRTKGHAESAPASSVSGRSTGTSDTTSATPSVRRSSSRTVGGSAPSRRSTSPPGPDRCARSAARGPVSADMSQRHVQGQLEWLDPVSGLGQQ